MCVVSTLDAVTTGEEIRKVNAAIVGVSIGILAAGGLFAQSGAVPLTFEVASIKPSSPDARGTSLQL